AATGKVRRVLGEVPGMPTDAVLSADGRVVALGRDHKVIHLLETATGKELRRIVPGGEPVVVVLSPDGGRLAVNCRAETEVRLWDVVSGKELGRFNRPLQEKK